MAVLFFIKTKLDNCTFKREFWFILQKKRRQLTDAQFQQGVIMDPFMLQLQKILSCFCKAGLLTEHLLLHGLAASSSLLRTLDEHS